MELQGRVTQILAEQTGQGRNGQWRKNSFVVEVPGQYPKSVCFQVWGDKFNQMPVKVGEMVTVSFDVESREYNGNWYTDVKAWKVMSANQQPQAPQQTASTPPPFETNAVPPGPEPDRAENFEDDLPF